MKFAPFNRSCRRAYALVMVMLFGVVGLLTLAGAISWVQTHGTVNARTNQRYRAMAAAEAASEKIVAHLNNDFLRNGQAWVYTNLSSYSQMVPSAAENSIWSEFQFSDAQGNTNRTYITRSASVTYQPLESAYTGLSGFSSTYRVVANARERNSMYNVVSAVQQEVKLASIPIFQFAIFYQDDMQFFRCEDMYIRGKVHSNQDLEFGSSSSVTFYEKATTSGVVLYQSIGGFNTNGAVNFEKGVTTNFTSLTLPIGTTNSEAAVREVIKAPADGESIDSAIGRQRFYNKAEMLVLVSNASVTVKVKSPFSASGTTVPWLACTNFLSTNKVFTDQREAKEVMTTEVDIAKLSTWAATNSAVSSVLGAGTPPNILFVGDYRTETASKMAGVRLVNGQTLPSRGLTVATPNPLYTKGHYNQPTSGHLGTTNTSDTRPAALVSDAYTLLSADFDDAESDANYATRTAADTTVVAALITGHGAAAEDWYNGGIHNLSRLLEKWSGRSYTLNGSVVCLFTSEKANSNFQSSGVYYSAPTRNINFDSNFLDPDKLPPGTPELRLLIRSKWYVPPSGTTTYAGP